MTRYQAWMWHICCVVLAGAVHIYAADWIAGVRAPLAPVSAMGGPDVVKVDIRLSQVTSVPVKTPASPLPVRKPCPVKKRRTAKKIKKKSCINAPDPAEPDRGASIDPSPVADVPAVSQGIPFTAKASTKPKNDMAPQEKSVDDVSDHPSLSKAALPPGMTRPIRPRYPRSSRLNREEGTVTLWFLVLENGRAKDIRVIESSGYTRLDHAAIGAVKSYRFIPAEEDHAPKESACSLAITFRLNT